MSGFGGDPACTAHVRDREIIGSELRLLAAVRRTAREAGTPMPTTAPMDELLDERLGHRPRSPETPDDQNARRRSAVRDGF
jgi:hypothetical protein